MITYNLSKIQPIQGGVMKGPIDYLDPEKIVKVIIANQDGEIIFFFSEENTPEDVRKKKAAILASGIAHAERLANFYVEGFTGLPEALRERIKELKKTIAGTKKPQLA